MVNRLGIPGGQAVPPPPSSASGCREPRGVGEGDNTDMWGCNATAPPSFKGRSH